MSTQHRTVIVTGAAGNLGKAVAHAFAGLEANLVLVDLERESLERVCAAVVSVRIVPMSGLLRDGAISTTLPRTVSVSPG